MAKPAFLLFGATGDLARRMLWPSLFHLHAEGLLPDGLMLIGSSRSDYDDAAFAAFLTEALEAFGHQELRGQGAMASFLARVRYVSVNVHEASAYGPLAELLQSLEVDPLLCYLSVAPGLYKPICSHLAGIGAVRPSTRLMLEKPIGHDFDSCREICDAVGSIFDESQVYRVDHYLGKETVQNLLALRFANSLFEPIWGAHAIDHVQITVAETVGVEGRWSYYDDAGALRDMVQNHILQTLALVAMEPPSDFEASAVRNEKVKVLQSLRPINAHSARQHTVTGQYVAGVSGYASVPGYLQEAGAVQGSRTETYVAVAAHIDNWRWKGVPFFLRTGKRLERRSTEIMVQFRDVPHNIFGDSQAGMDANRLHIRLQPEETITLQLMSKRPGLSGIQLKPVALNLSLTEAFDSERRRIAYERLLLDAFCGNSTLFVRRDELEAAWRWIDGIHAAWDEIGLEPKAYPAGTPGPVAADRMLEAFGAQWHD
ncbi:MAG: glucose-6-phosphate dehydrogenase [Xanthomonadales bacterium]|nr:glucose-6-phosphate dehydrogenase [Xanthomonadales bacterium]